MDKKLALAIVMTLVILGLAGMFMFSITPVKENQTIEPENRTITTEDIKNFIEDLKAKISLIQTILFIAWIVITVIVVYILWRW